jgi:uncharacterized protein HemX
MVFLGTLIAVAAVGLGIAIVTDNSASASLNVFGHRVPGVTSDAQIFLAGVVVTIFLVIGLAIAVMALGRSMRNRRELRHLREEHEESMTALELEKRQLERELARARNGAALPAPGDVHVAPRRSPDRDPVSPFFDQPA